MWPALIAAGAQLLSGAISRGGQQQTNATNVAIARDTNQFNAQQAQTQRDFEERMSDTQYQRAVADMRAAGLNPALAYQQGGAGTPSGATASGVTTRVDNPDAGLAASIPNSITSAYEAMNTYKQGKLIDAQTATQKAQAYKTAIEGSLAALDQNRLSDDDIQSLLKKTLSAQLQSIQANAAQGFAQAASTNQNTAQTKMTEGWQRIAQPWINDAQGAARLFRTAIAAIDPFIE